ncbi:aliphatic amidase regulator [Mycolicibacterium mageritense DSM 44476 = CIP 104973]
MRTLARDAEWRLAMVVPLQGPAGLFGPSCEAVGDLVAHDLNAAGGVLGREVHIEVVDGGAHPKAVAAEINRLIEEDRIDAVSGWHISSVRNALAPVVAGRVPYSYPALYEGGERRRGIYCCGETPDQQIAPALRWMRDNLGIRKWFVVGDDYVWPRTSLAEVRRYVRELSLDLVGGSFVALGHGDIDRLVDKVAQSRCEAVLMLLVGQDAVEFNRTFARRGLQDEKLRFSPLMDENMLIASGHDATQGLFVAASYFRSMVGRNSMELLDRYLEVNGSSAPALGNAAESCYEGAYFLAEMINRAGDGLDIEAVSEGAAYDSPRGTVEFKSHRTSQPVHLAVAAGVDFEIVTTLPGSLAD